MRNRYRHAELGGGDLIDYNTNLIRIFTTIMYSGTLSISNNIKFFITGPAILYIRRILKKEFKDCKIGKYNKDVVILGKNTVAEKIYITNTALGKKVLNDNWSFRCGEKNIPNILLKNKDFLFEYIASVIDCCGQFLFYKSMNCSTAMRLQISIYHIKDFENLIRIFDEHSIGYSFITDDGRRGKGHKIIFNGHNLENMILSVGDRLLRRRHTDMSNYYQENNILGKMFL